MSDAKAAVLIGTPFTRSIRLLDGETWIRQSVVRHQRFILAPVGILTLTNQRLIFLPYWLMLSWPRVVIPLPEIEEVGEKRTSFPRNLSAGAALHLWKVRTKYKSYVFWAPKRETKSSFSRADWIIAVSTMAEHARAQLDDR